MAIRFHLDEQVSPIVADLLRQHGIDVTTSQDAGLLGKSDDVQLSYAIAQRRALVTCDARMTRREVTLSTKYGICYCHAQKFSLAEFVSPETRRRMHGRK